MLINETPTPPTHHVVEINQKSIATELMALTEADASPAVEEPNSEHQFPVNAFPSPFRELILECNTALNFPVEYTGIAMLSAVSTIIGTTAKLKVKEGWYEFPSLFCTLIGNAGANKSHPLNMVFNPIRETDCKTLKVYEQLYNEYQEYDSLSKKEKEDAAKLTKPVLVKSILDNFTPEILHQRLFDNKRGCAVVADEMATFFEGMNNYSKGDQVSTYLSFYSNKPTSIDRVSRPVPLFIQEPFLNIIGSIQPRMINKLFPANKIDNGLLQRFLHAYPQDTLKYPITDMQVDRNVLLRYELFIKQYIIKHPVSINAENGKVDSEIYVFSQEAKNYFYEWQGQNTMEVNNYSDSLLSEVLSKFDMHFVRLALILQIMEDDTARVVNLPAVKAAKDLCDYFIATSKKILRAVGGPDDLADITPLKKEKLFELLPDEFTTGDAIRISSGLCSERTISRLLKEDHRYKKLLFGKWSKIKKE